MDNLDDFIFERPAKKSVRFDVFKSVGMLEMMMDDLPTDDQCFKLFSPQGGWSAISMVLWMCRKAHIKNMIVSSFRVGKKEIRHIVQQANSGNIDRCFFYLSHMFRRENEHYEEDYFEKAAEENDFGYAYSKNHSKLLLFDTDKGKFVIETSSNLNDNPFIEFFSFEKSDVLYDFYAEKLAQLAG